MDRHAYAIALLLLIPASLKLRPDGSFRRRGIIGFLCFDLSEHAGVVALEPLNFTLQGPGTLVLKPGKLVPELSLQFIEQEGEQFRGRSRRRFGRRRGFACRWSIEEGRQCWRQRSSGGEVHWHGLDEPLFQPWA